MLSSTIRDTTDASTCSPTITANTAALGSSGARSACDCADDSVGGVGRSYRVGEAGELAADEGDDVYMADVAEPVDNDAFTVTDDEDTLLNLINAGWAYCDDIIVRPL